VYIYIYLYPQRKAHNFIFKKKKPHLFQGGVDVIQVDLLTQVLEVVAKDVELRGVHDRSPIVLHPYYG
jgi:hypothetical protein